MSEKQAALSVDDLCDYLSNCVSVLVFNLLSVTQLIPILAMTLW